MLLLLAVNLYADGQVDLVKENAELKQRLGRLEQELAELREIVLSQRKDAAPPAETPIVAPPSQQHLPAAPADMKLTDDQVDRIAEMVEKREKKEKGPFAGFDFIPYGFIKLDASYDTSQMNNGNFAAWVLSEEGNRNDDEFNMTAKATRLGLRINSREKSDILATGLVEVDFFGDDNGGENRPGILVRHAYAKLEWPEERFSILAGQYWDVISPLNPNVLNYTVQWFAGNIGYRRPQVRATKVYALSDTADLKLEAAVTRNIGGIPRSIETPDTGADSGIPAFQGRVSSTFPFFGPQPTTVGFSGHWGKEELDTVSGEKHFDSWSLNLDITQPVNDWLAIQAELFTGENLATYFGGIGQGVNVARKREIASRGGWVAARLTPYDKWSFNLGVSLEDVDGDDLVGMAAAREYNRAVFGNVIYSINKSTDVGFELSHWRTDYKGRPDADSIRAQTSLIYKF